MQRHRQSFHENGHAHELTFTCYRRYPFFKAERTCRWLVDSIESARTQHSFELWAYVFMPDHIHLLIYPTEADADMARILRAIKAPIARKAIQFIKQNSPEWLPKITRKRGAKDERLFWQSGGGYDRNVITKQTLLAMSDYIHENPVRKEFVQRPRDLFWSSAAWFDDQTEIPMPVDKIPFDWLE